MEPFPSNAGPSRTRSSQHASLVGVGGGVQGYLAHKKSPEQDGGGARRRDLQGHLQGQEAGWGAEARRMEGQRRVDAYSPGKDLSHSLYLLNGFRKSTPPQNRQLLVSIGNSKRQVDDGGVDFLKQFNQ